MSRNITNNNREILYARSTITNQPEYIGSTNHALNINATISSDGIATSANQTNGSQLTQIVDAGGEAVTVTGGKLDVNATASLAGESLPISGATEAVGVAIVDSSGNQISSFGGGTQYTNGDIDASPTGTVAMWLNTGDNSINAISDTAPLPVTVDSGNINIANSVPVKGTVASGNNDDDPTVIKIGTQYNATQPTFVDGARGELQITNRGDLKSQITNGSGASAVNIQDGGNSITIDNSALTSLDSKTTTVNTDSVIVASVTPATGASNLGKAEDAAHSSSDVGVFALGVRNDTLAAATSTNGDYSQVSTGVGGEVIVAGAPRLLKARQVTTITASTSETTIVTAIASTFNDIYGLVLSNTSASATEVTIRDATAGGTISSFMVPAGDTRGFMLPLDSAIPQATVNNNWTAQCSASVTSLKVTALYVKRV